MTQILVTLGKDANPNLIQKIFESIRGVVHTSIQFKKDEERDNNFASDILGCSNECILPTEKIKWLEELNTLCDNIDRSKIDYEDEKNKYILSK